MDTVAITEDLLRFTIARSNNVLSWIDAKFVERVRGRTQLPWTSGYKGKDRCRGCSQIIPKSAKLPHAASSYIFVAHRITTLQSKARHAYWIHGHVFGKRLRNLRSNYREHNFCIVCVGAIMDSGRKPGKAAVLAAIIISRTMAFSHGQDSVKSNSFPRIYSMIITNSTSVVFFSPLQKDY